ncbi:hypothetical protein HDU96_008338 [Phlyctochytrium bullatum]|nr:hypothetical protein HDU96_008338 [Phlyctochytrium bullatum]
MKLLAKMDKPKEELQAHHEIVKEAKDSVDDEKTPVEQPQGEQDAKKENDQKRQMEAMLKQSERSGTDGKKELSQKDYFDDTPPPATFFSILPASSVWCDGDSVETR